ncbi:MAG: hypothetical protein GY953_12725, partial [bacterium]|nr:hypothetical protein [bacterium]
GGDLVRIECEPDQDSLQFFKEAEGLELQHMTEIVESNGGPLQKAAVVAAVQQRQAPAAKSTRRG